MRTVLVAAAEERLLTLLDLIKHADLNQALAGPGPFTIFAPRDAAFPEGPALDFFKEGTPMDTLVGILTYHVVPGKKFSKDFLDGQTLTTLEGNALTISLDNSGAMVNDFNIVRGDIEASNGLIHIIDGVLLPPRNNTTTTQRSGELFNRA